jgi:endonuclease/exonuclease/phosphatase family metal-dependent hydrolase
VTVKVMTFNVLYGAGHDRRFDMNIPARFRDRNRMPELIAFLKQADADIIAFEEAGGWDAGSPSAADQIAAALGMTYVIAHDPWELHVMLFSKFPIVDAEYVSRDQGFNGVLLRATVAVTPTARLNVLASHLNSMSSETRACQLAALLELAEPLRRERVLIAGDMNIRPEDALARQLSGAGWQLIVAQPTWPIDQIWADPAATVGRGEWWQGLTPPEGISDHLPIGAEITLSLPRTATAATTADGRLEPRARSYACPLPPPRP